MCLQLRCLIELALGIRCQIDLRDMSTIYRAYTNKWCITPISAECHSKKTVISNTNIDNLSWKNLILSITLTLNRLLPPQIPNHIALFIFFRLTWHQNWILLKIHAIPNLVCFWLNTTLITCHLNVFEYSQCSSLLRLIAS
jgi:hypothetical protein